MSGKLKWMAGLLFENFWWKLASLAIATAIWALVASEPELATFATVRLEYRNLPEDLDLSSEPVTSVILELQGPTGELRGLGENARLAVVLDMSGVRPGERTFTIDGGTARLPRGVLLVRSIPSEVRLHFETRAERDIEVVPRFTGVDQHGYVIGRYTVDPARLRISGPGSHVARASAATTDPVDVSSAVGISEYRVNAFVEDPFVHFLSSPRVVVTVIMKKK